MLAFDITGFAQSFAQLRPKGMDIRIAYDKRTNSIHLRQLPTRRERPRGCGAAEQRDELAAPHSITSSARTRIPVGNSMPIALATLRLITSSNFDTCSTGRSAGLVPLSTRAT